MTKQERLIVSAYTGVLMCGFLEFHNYVEQLLQRPVYQTCRKAPAFRHGDIGHTLFPR